MRRSIFSNQVLNKSFYYYYIIITQPGDHQMRGRLAENWLEGDMVEHDAQIPELRVAGEIRDQCLLADELPPTRQVQGDEVRQGIVPFQQLVYRVAVHGFQFLIH